jgi:DNA-binding transcriptional ArsR family regulator
MKIAVISDSHDNRSKFKQAVVLAKQLNAEAILHCGERTVRELENLVGLRQTTLSQHLARLRYEGLVNTRRAAQNIYYSISSNEGNRLLGAIHGMYCDSDTNPDTRTA